MAEVKLPHPGHEKHLCYLNNLGFQKSDAEEYKAQKRVYDDTSVIHSVKSHPIDQYVEVESYIKGCLIGVCDLTEMIITILLEKNRISCNTACA